MNEQNLSQFLSATRQYLFGQAPAQHAISTETTPVVH